MRKLIIGLVLFLAAIGAWWYASPLWTLRQMRDAAQARDADKLSAYVDYLALREDLKGEMRRSIMTELGKSKQPNGFEALGSMFAMTLIDPMIDAMVTPEGVAAMFDQAKRSKVQSNRPQLPQAASQPIVERKSFDRFIVRDKDPTKASMTFTRHGLGWKLSGVDIPPQVPSAKPTTK